MRAMRIVEYGEPLVLQDIDVPKPSSKGAIVKVLACGVCHSDLHLIDGLVKTEELGGTRPYTPGHEVAAQVFEVGPEATNLKVGDLMLVNWLVSCGECEYCRLGAENLCERLTLLGINADGGYAEYLHIPKASNLLHLDGLSPEDACTLACSGTTMFRVIRRSQLIPGQYLVVYGVGGLGVMAIQIARAFGVTEVIAVDIIEEKLRLAEKLGAHYVVDGRQDPVNRVLELTRQKGAKVVIDLVGSDETLQNSMKMLGKLGKLFAVGIGKGTIRAYSTDLLNRELEITSVLCARQEDFVGVLALAKKGLVKPVISKVLRLEEANEAIEELRLGKLLGRAILKP